MLIILIVTISTIVALWTYFRPIKNDRNIILFDIRKSMGEKWDMNTQTGYWVPLDGIKTKHIEFFNFKNFITEFGLQKLKVVVSDIENSTIFELNELIDDNEINISEMDIRDDMTELYYTCKSFEWVIYKSHENTITFAGDILLEKIKQEWPGWEKFSGKL
jgi:hypothetical protein